MTTHLGTELCLMTTNTNNYRGSNAYMSARHCAGHFQEHHIYMP